MKYNHIEEILLIIAAHAFVIYNIQYVHAYGFNKLTVIFYFLGEGEFSSALIYLTPFLFYLLAIVIFLRKKEILGFKKKQEDKE